jgi:hypothetical protein
VPRRAPKLHFGLVAGIVEMGKNPIGNLALEEKEYLTVGPEFAFTLMSSNKRHTQAVWRY